nr:MAG TPA: IrrE protein [Caudoviricetes sp.]
MKKMTEQKAIKTLIQNRNNVLPIEQKDLEDIIQDLGWDIVYLSRENTSDNTLLQELSLTEMADKYNGFSVKIQPYKIVFIKTDMTYAETTYTLAHELGHIVMRHFTETGILGKHSQKSYDIPQEAEADKFARNILAPICLLRELGIKDISELEKCTILRGEPLKIHYADYIECHSRYTQDEKMLIGNFQNYIKSYRRESVERVENIKDKKTIKGNKILYMSLFFGAALIASMLFLFSNNKTTAPLPTATQQSEIKQTIEINGINYDKNMTVYKTRAGTKAHRENCRHITGKTGLTTTTLAEALAGGIDLCKDCF